MHKLLGLDIGDRRIGVAIGTFDPSFSRPLATFERADGAAERSILQIIEQEEVQDIIAGLPLSEDGANNEQCNKIEKFCSRIFKRCDASITFVDEYATTLEAQDAVKNLKRSGARKRSGLAGQLDAVSAALILEGYLKNPQVFIKRWEARSAGSDLQRK